METPRARPHLWCPRALHTCQQAACQLRSTHTNGARACPSQAFNDELSALFCSGSHHFLLGCEAIRTHAYWEQRVAAALLFGHRSAQPDGSTSRHSTSELLGVSDVDPFEASVPSKKSLVFNDTLVEVDSPRSQSQRRRSNRHGAKSVESESKRRSKALTSWVSVGALPVSTTVPLPSPPAALPRTPSSPSHLKRSLSRASSAEFRIAIGGKVPPARAEPSDEFSVHPSPLQGDCVPSELSRLSEDSESSAMKYT